jgi:hypothetical protein
MAKKVVASTELHHSRFIIFVFQGIQQESLL